MSTQKKLFLVNPTARQQVFGNILAPVGSTEISRKDQQELGGIVTFRNSSCYTQEVARGFLDQEQEAAKAAPKDSKAK